MWILGRGHHAFDEVVTGFRLSLGGAQEAFGVKPDIAALGKILGGGLPMAAVAGRRDVLDLAVPGRPQDGRSIYLSGTLNGNALSAAAGLATLDVLAEENGPERLAAIGDKLRQELIDCAKRLSIPFQMIGPPALAEPVFGTSKIENYRDYSQSNRVAARRFGVELLKRDIFVHPGSKFYISMVHDDDLIAETSAASAQAMRVVRDELLVG